MDGVYGDTQALSPSTVAHVQQRWKPRRRSRFCYEKVFGGEVPKTLRDCAGPLEPVLVRFLLSLTVPNRGNHDFDPLLSLKQLSRVALAEEAASGAAILRELFT